MSFQSGTGAKSYANILRFIRMMKMMFLNVLVEKICGDHAKALSVTQTVTQTGIRVSEVTVKKTFYGKGKL